MACRPNIQIIQPEANVHGEGSRTFEDWWYESEAWTRYIGELTSVPEQVGSGYQEDDRYVAAGTWGSIERGDVNGV
jgi:hypothetical protein